MAKKKQEHIQIGNNHRDKWVSKLLPVVATVGNQGWNVTFGAKCWGETGCRWEWLIVTERMAPWRRLGLASMSPHHLQGNPLMFISTTIALLGGGTSTSHSQKQLVYCWMSVLVQEHGSDTAAQQAIPRAMDVHPQPWELVPWLLDKSIKVLSPQYPTDF